MPSKNAPARPGRLRRTFAGWSAVSDPTWWWRALCAGRETEVWFPDDGEPVIVAKSYCRRCPVRSDCLAHAMERVEPYGVWGGLTEHERGLLRARVSAASASAARRSGGDDGPVAA
jgi:WhiB family transcriptional regulator, redox-sensing transcriptional regulator